MAVAVARSDQRGELERLWRDRIGQARDYRRQFEPTWLSNFAFGKGQHWLVWDEKTMRMRHLSEVDPRFENAELYIADKINEHVQAQLGELDSDDDRPELLLAQEGDAAEEIQEELNDCAGHGWDHEWKSEVALEQARRLCLKLGVAAIRVRFDPAKGPLESHVPVHPLTGQPVLDERTLAHLEQRGALPDGQLPQFKPVREGLTLWEWLSAFNLLTPPGCSHEDKFPWEIVVRPVLLDDVNELYDDRGLVEDDDIASTVGITTAQAARSGADKSAGKGRLRDSVWLFTCYERPCPKYPDGQVVHLASNQIKLLDVEEQLPVETVTGERRTGIHYFHWWRNDDTFWSRAFIEPLKDPQRIINRRESQKTEIIDRGQPKVFVKEGTLKSNPAGLPLEVVELKPDAAEPSFHQGIGPGDWIDRDLERQADNMAHASTLSQLRLGENPPNVLTLGQLSLLNENESGKRSTILQQHKRAIAGCVEDSMFFVRKYWPDKKRILVEGDEGAIRQKVFSKSRIPDFYVVRVATGSVKPRSQGAELTKVDAIWAAAVACGVAVGSNADKWIEWYAKSLDAGQAVELPAALSDSQVEMARFENFLMLDQGEEVAPADYDLLPAHVPVHREAQNQARAAEDWESFARIERHVQASIALTQANAMRVAVAQQVPSPLTSPAPPSTPSAPTPAPPVVPPGLGVPPEQGAQP